MGFYIEKCGTMEKLIGLLNEYETFKVGVKPRSLLNGELLCDGIPSCEQIMYGVLICAKPYGFIGWLVENDKIDRSKVLEEIGGCIKISGLGPHYSFYSALLMILAVSDTPIDDLISYLM